MSAGSIVTPVAKVWVYPVVALCLVGAPALAVSWSGAFSTGVSTGAGIIVADLPALGEGFQNGQKLGGADVPADAATAG